MPLKTDASDRGTRQYTPLITHTFIMNITIIIIHPVLFITFVFMFLFLLFVHIVLPMLFPFQLPEYRGIPPRCSSKKKRATLV